MASAAPPPFAAYHGVSGATHQTRFNELSSQGFRMISLSVDIGRATMAGIDVKGVSGTFKLDPDGLTFDKVRIADLADAAFNLNGRMEGALDAPRGTVTFDVDARGLDGTVAVGTDEIRVECEAMLSLDSRVTLTTRFAVEMGDLALLSNYWCTDGDTPFASGTAEVARRQPDGRWLYVIDNPLGAPVDLPAP